MRHPNARLTPAQVRDIHNAYKNKGLGIAELAAQYRLNPSTIQRIVLGKTWRWMGLAPVIRTQRKYVWDAKQERIQLEDK